MEHIMPLVSNEFSQADYRISEMLSRASNGIQPLCFCEKCKAFREDQPLLEVGNKEKSW